MKEDTKKYYSPIILTLVILALLLTGFINISYQAEGQHFIELAQSFLQGRLDLIASSPGRGDVAAINGKAYWPLGPFPALVLLPFVALGGGAISIGLIGFPLILITAFFVVRLARQVGFTSNDQLWLAFAFLFASPYVAAAWVPRSWQFAHIVAVLLMFAALYEYLTKKRLWLIGLLYAGIIATRLPAGVTISFFIFDTLWVNRETIGQGIKKLIPLALGPLVAVGLLLLYNYARFGMPLEVGYAFANLGPDLVAMRAYGVLSIRHLPGNLYYFLFASPLPVTESIGHTFKPPYITSSMWGVGMLFSAPYFFGLLFKRYCDRLQSILWIATILTALPVLLYFAIGPFQQAFRYALDFLPLLFLIFMRAVYAVDKKLDPAFKVIIIIAFFLNLYLFFGGIFRVL